MKHLEPPGWNEPPDPTGVEEAWCTLCNKPLNEDELDALQREVDEYPGEEETVWAQSVCDKCKELENE